MPKVSIVTVSMMIGSNGGYSDMYRDGTMGANFIGDGLRDILDPKLNKKL